MPRLPFPALWVAAVTIASTVSAPGAGLTLVGHHDVKHGTSGDGVSYSACWGYVAPDLREYAILTTYTGTAIVDITDTSDIHEIVHIPGPTSIWREVRTYRDRLYVVTEGGGGTQIIDLSQLPDTAVLVKSFTYTSGTKNTGRAHTIEIFDGYMYLNGCATWGTTAQRGAVIFSLADPDNPAYAGEYSPNYFHDSYVRNDTIYGASIYSTGGIYIADITNKAAPSQIGKISYTGSGTHNVWLTKTGSHLISTDEIGTTAKNLKFWDMGSLPTMPSATTSTYAVNPTDIGHNVFVRGDYAYAAWYTAGIAVADVSNPAAPFTAGSYDTSTEPTGYDGVWAVYPYYWSGKVIAGDMQNGLFVFTFDSLEARTPVSLLEPLDSTLLESADPVLFRWTRAADPVDDPHEYRLVIEGAGYDTTIETGSDTTVLFSDVVGMGNGPFTWRVLTVDEITEVPAQDTFALMKALVSVESPNGGERLQMGSVSTLTWTALLDSVELHFSDDGGSTWTPIATVPGSPGEYEWTVPVAPTYTGLLRVRNPEDSTVIDESDDVFFIHAAEVAVEEGWNLASVPSEPINPLAIKHFPGAASAPFHYTGGYAQAESLESGRGFWIRYDQDATESSVGMPIESDTVPVQSRWNIVGSLTEPVDVLSIEAVPGSMTLTDFFGYSPDSGYTTADSIRPGFGYWVKVSEAGSLVLDAAAASAAGSARRTAHRAPANTLTFTSGGRTRVLRFEAGGSPSDGLRLHELPPPPPAGEFDVRFAEGTAMRSGVLRSAARIFVQGAGGGVQVRLVKSGEDAGAYLLRPETPRGPAPEIRLSEIPAELAAASGWYALEPAPAALPAEFRLHPNHPNPFNPQTVIGYEIPAETRVRLEVFSVLGERIATLVDEVQEAGYRTAVFRGDGLPSGTYFYRLNAGGFSRTGKMLLAR